MKPQKTGLNIPLDKSLIYHKVQMHLTTCLKTNIFHKEIHSKTSETWLTTLSILENPSVTDFVK